jgi:hypothetical protein
MRRFFLRSIQSVFIAILCLVGWCGWYLAFYGVPVAARNRLVDEIKKSGVNLSLGRITFDPLRGLVAREVRILDPESPGRRIASIDRIRLDIDFARMIRKQPYLDGLDLRRATLSIPVTQTAHRSRYLEVSNLDAQIQFPPDQVVLKHASATVLGIRIAVRGSLARPSQWRSLLPPNMQHGEGESPMLPKFLDLVQSFRYPKGPAVLDVTVDGDMARPESIVAEASLTAPSVVAPPAHFDDFVLSVALRDQNLMLRELSCKDRFGSAEIRGAMALRTGQFEYEGASSLDLEPFLQGMAGKWLRECSFYGLPAIAFSGTYDAASARISAMGSATFGRFAIRSVVFDGASADFRIKDGNWYLADATIRHRSGKIDGVAMMKDGKFRATLSSDIDPDEMAPLATGKVATMLSEWKFEDAPRLRLDIRGPSPSPDACKIAGSLSLGKTLFRNLPIESVTSNLAVEDGAISYSGFTVKRAEGSATGNFEYDFKDREVRLSAVKSTLSPKDVVIWIDPKLLKDIVPYRFKKPPYVEVDGKVDLAGGESTDLRVNVSAPTGLHYRFINRDLDSRRATTRLHLLGQTLFLKDLDASLMGGRVGANAAFSVKPGDLSYKATIKIRDVDFPSFTKLYFNYDELRGRLHGEYDFTGAGVDARTMRGKGTAEVIDGNVFAIPIFGPLSSILNSIVPGLGFNVAKRASASYQVRDGIITTDDFLVRGNGFSMLGGGQLFFLDDRMTFDVRLNAQGLPGTLLFPVSKLFEYRSEGKMSKPSWKAKNIPIL